MLPYQILLGKNAFFMPLTNTIQYKNKLALSQFHELGHAMNYNNKGLGKLLWKVRPEALSTYITNKAFHLGKNLKFPIAAVIGALALPIISFTVIFKNKKVFIFCPTIDICEFVYKAISKFVLRGNRVHSKCHDRSLVYC